MTASSRWTGTVSSPCAKFFEVSEASPFGPAEKGRGGLPFLALLFSGIWGFILNPLERPLLLEVCVASNGLVESGFQIFRNRCRDRGARIFIPDGGKSGTGLQLAGMLFRFFPASSFGAYPAARPALRNVAVEPLRASAALETRTFVSFWAPLRVPHIHIDHTGLSVWRRETVVYLPAGVYKMCTELGAEWLCY